MKNNPIKQAVILVQHFLKKYVTSLTFLVFLLALEACDFEVNPDNQENTNIISTNFRAFFDAYWREMNRSYVFWDIDGTDWDKVYTEYAPKFDTLEIGNQAHEKIAGMYFREILSGLSDSHYNVDFSSFRGMTQNDTIINGLFLPGISFSPALWRKAQAENFYLGLLDPATPDLYADVDFQNYLDPENRYRVSTDNGGLTKPEELLVGTIQQKILYIRISTFNLTSRYSFDNKVREVLNFFFKTLAAIPSNKIKGVIVDVRQNGGGDLRDLNLLMGRFVSKPTHFGYQHYKNGDNRLDYTPWLPFFVKPIAKAISAKVKGAFVGPNITRHLDYLEGELQNADWFAGNEFSAADVQMSFPLEAAAARAGLDNSRPRLMAWLERIHARPAYHRALEKGGPFEILG